MAKLSAVGIPMMTTIVSILCDVPQRDEISVGAVLTMDRDFDLWNGRERIPWEQEKTLRATGQLRNIPAQPWEDVDVWMVGMDVFNQVEDTLLLPTVRVVERCDRAITCFIRKGEVGTVRAHCARELVQRARSLIESRHLQDALHIADLSSYVSEHSNDECLALTALIVEKIFCLKAAVRYINERTNSAARRACIHTMVLELQKQYTVFTR